MKILYGVQGTGNGHISRARIMAQHLRANNVDVSFLFSGREKSRFFEMDIFADYQCRRGLSFTTIAGQVSYWHTVRDNNLAEFIRDVRQLDVTPYDVIISDFEPVTAWAARFAKKPSIGIGHQYAFAHRVPVAGENPVTSMIMRYFAPTDIAIGLHWHHFDCDILPPIVDTRLQRQPAAQDYRLVYLPMEDQAQVSHILNAFPHQRFIQYSPDLQDGESGNVQLRKNCLQGFKNDLCGAHGVICNAGFALISECLHMGIPVLAKPLGGQMEQLSNARALRDRGIASVMDSLDSAVISQWLDTPSAKPQPYPDVAARLVEWIMAGDWSASSRRQLTDTLWANTG